MSTAIILLLWCLASTPCDALAAPETFRAFLTAQQTRMIADLELLDGRATFGRDEWSREDGSRGVTRVIESGAVIEKGCVSTSFVQGVLTPQRAEAMSSRGRACIDPAGGQRFEAAALSLVLHPASPFVPTLRGDARCFIVYGEDDSPREAWYGGGCDLTPVYLFDEDAAEFHAFWKEACEARRPGAYAALKQCCDEYFYLPLRREHRGVGGIFWDDDAGGEGLARDVLEGMVASWRPIVERRRATPVDARHRDWQLLRRGRYLEFNLLNDRGVKFGLSPDAIERIMVSAPPLIAWKYQVVPEEGSEEERLLDVLREPKEWA